MDAEMIAAIEREAAAEDRWYDTEGTEVEADASRELVQARKHRVAVARHFAAQQGES